MAANILANVAQKLIVSVNPSKESILTFDLCQLSLQYARESLTLKYESDNWFSGPILPRMIDIYVLNHSFLVSVVLYLHNICF